MAVTIGGSPPTDLQKTELQEAFALIGMNADDEIPDGPPAYAVEKTAWQKIAFRDDFRRPDTLSGQLGAGWVLYGAYVSSYPLPAATDGNIIDMQFVAPLGEIVYATKTLSQKATYLQTRFSWKDLGSGTHFTTLSAIISSSANIIDTMLHITLVSNLLRVQKRVSGGSFIDLITPVAISPSLALVDTPHVLSIFVTDTTCRVVVDDKVDVSVTDADIETITGPYVAIEHYTASTSVRYPLAYLDFEAGPA